MPKRSAGVAAVAQDAGSTSGVPWSMAMAERWNEILGDHPQREGILHKMSHSLASTTASTYGGHWRRFVEWCESQGDQPNPLPASTQTVVRWVEDVTAGGKVHKSSENNPSTEASVGRNQSRV